MYLIIVLVVTFVQSLSHVRLFVITWTAACQASLSLTSSQILPKFMFIESVMPSNHLLLPSIFQASGSFQMSHLFASGSQSIGASASASALPMNIQGWFPLKLTGLISLLSKELQESSPAPQFESISSLALSLLYGPTLTTIPDYWKDHSLDYKDFYRQSDVFAF